MSESLKTLEKRLEDLGMTGDTYEAHLATSPVVPQDIHIRCYYEARPLYEFLVGYLRECSLISAPVPFDLSIMQKFERYLTILSATNDPSNEIVLAGVKIAACLQLIKRMLAGEVAYFQVMEASLKLLAFDSEGYPSKAINAEGGYSGEDFEELVDKYCAEIAEHRASAQKIAAENIAKQLAKQGGDTV